jgi:membrane dipeptidase
MTLRFLGLLLFLTTTLSCNRDIRKDDVSADEQLRHKADSLAHAVIIADSHVDLPYRLRVIKFRLDREYLGIPISSNEGDFDYERAKKGGLDVPFM